MITREEYLKALDIVEAYHEQLNLSIVRRSYKSLAETEIGESIEVVAVHEQSLKCLTQGKKYEIVNTEGDRHFKYIWIIDDNGKRKRYNSTNRMFKALLKIR